MKNKLPISKQLEGALHYLLKTQHSKHSCDCGTHHEAPSPQWIFEADTWSQLQTLRKTLCQRPTLPKLPQDNLAQIEAVLKYHNQHKLLTSTTSIRPTVTLQSKTKPTDNTTQTTSPPLRLSCWKGDITTLSDITAIVNAANSQLEGCFQPEHRCIDNAIHTAAGPRLREACHDLIREQGYLEPTGSVKVTPGFLLPAPWVLHTVGPQLPRGGAPRESHKRELAACYRACLDAVESSLPPLEDGRKVVAFCCISTGLFAFPAALAAKIAVETVVDWYRERNASGSASSITDVIFDTFLESDLLLYRGLLSGLESELEGQGGSGLVLSSPSSYTPDASELLGYTALSPSVMKARAWLEDVSTVIISAGAGLSAATGLDYTSTALFDSHFPAFKAMGLRRLYDVFGYEGWNSLGQKWGYFFLHLDMVRRWPVSPVYAALRGLVDRFDEGKYHIRTTNADGFFVKNGFPDERVSTPQGQYKYLQCFRKCRADAVFPSGPFVDAALPFIDPVSQELTDEALVPTCKFCGGGLTICVRGGSYFNPGPFRGQEKAWKGFLEGLDSTSTGETVILELGVGLNTPGVLRWPNEELVSESSGRQFRLIRVGMEASGCVPWELEEDDLVVGIAGDIGTALQQLS